jgi:uncharacterized protein (TIGR02594 family)
MPGTEAVRRLQELLNAVLNPSPNLKVDGLMGPRTRAALARYQEAKQTIAGDTQHRLISANSGTDTAAVDAGSNGWMSIAEGELGQAEIPGAQNNPRIVAYHATTGLHAETDEVAWCSSFVNWVMRQAGYVGTNSAAARSWVGWGQASEARYGAITVIKHINAHHDAATGSTSGFHVAFLLEVTDTHIRLLGGNQHDSVRVSSFRRTGYEIKAYRWPS